MGNSKEKNKKVKKKITKKTDIRQYALKKIESLSWDMGKKKYSSRVELYDR